MGIAELEEFFTLKCILKSNFILVYLLIPWDGTPIKDVVNKPNFIVLILLFEVVLLAVF